MVRNRARDAASQIERQLNRSLDARAAMQRGGAALAPVTQIVIAATCAYALAHFVLGHAVPLVAVTVTITILGFGRDAGPRRVFESAIGILVGIVLSEMLLMLVGSGVWQLAVVLFTTLLVARTLSPSAPFAIAAGVQSVLVMLLPVPEGGIFVRSLDGLVGGVVALAATALIPRNLRRLARNDSGHLVQTMGEALSSTVTALRDADEPAAARALDQLRRTQALVDQWQLSQGSAIANARISPFLRRHLPTLRYQATVLEGFDLAARHLRITTRRISFLVRDGERRPALASLVERIARGVALLGDSLERPALAAEARTVFIELMPELDPTVSLPHARMPSSIIVHLLRPLVVDLLVATGMAAAEARALLPSD